MIGTRFGSTVMVGPMLIMEQKLAAQQKLEVQRRKQTEAQSGQNTLSQPYQPAITAPARPIIPAIVPNAQLPIWGRTTPRI